ncbi:MotA/TolQ/ExbB proton channel family protein [Maledivibacter halophilus]|uniref:MotA/TolQ/ExbB proton channel family protein n=1 Tax=Maledivibacter halophilus TaxID=36842 RepID=A0A1T5JBI3_9FIRM|nr:MotA/TolQ/ExbB proton channel family protein [Maledivibacter halophilus]SKC48907.1 MotA/TolQ/ExbB proton channel family protein [Maledivibacter halophilus]
MSILDNIFSKLNPLAIVIIVVILGIFISAFVLSLSLKKKYFTMLWDLQDEENKESSMFENKVFNKIVDDYKLAAKGKSSEINTFAIIEKNFNNELKSQYQGERFVKRAVSLMIILGLLGTFYGLTMSIGELVKTLASSGGVDVLDSMDSVISGLIRSVRGMSVAFITSLFGIASSVLLTIINIFFGIEDIRESIMVEMEEYLDNILSQRIDEKKETPETLIKDELIASLNDFNGKLEESMKEISEVLSLRFASATSGIEQFSESLLKSVEKFENSLNVFSENTRDFSEFNHHLKTNIQRMNVSFNDFTEELKSNTKEIAIGLQIENLSKSVDKLADKVEK